MPPYASRQRLTLVAPLLAAFILAGCITNERVENEGRPPPGTSFVIVHLTDEGIGIPAEIEAGTVSFEVENNGTEPHGFAIEGSGVSERLDTLDPLDRGVLTVNLEPGRYTVYSPTGDDRQEGFEASIEVIEGLGPEVTEQPGVGPSDVMDPIEDEGP